ncbi:recombinase family protein [Brevundimonas sp.]|uniref:recombinase family protein n=1 Tax=Brevundimonas sp. TaxID=1871086 RepID=UPI00262998AB|nr:recombinase family protein [Brevundimonas sp.]
MKVIRCAIYTRKSSEEGLDQAFNSLHAQREACEAYIKSQAAEGWSLVPTLYDDGGFSGGNIERPGLKQLLADIDAGKIDTIVVYKIDRLTRALSDFARIVERLDAAGASFVSVTQAFNTTTSMGRLTLNVLLSFAQFEREVTGERIRDKIAQSKAKGMWMGGVPPMGYDIPTDPVTRALVVNPVETERVRCIFQRYLDLGSVSALEQWLGEQGWRTRERKTRRDETVGGVPFNRGALFHLLKNRVYLGEIVHRAGVVSGAHPAIVDPEVFDQVQRRLTENAAARSDRPLRSADLPLKSLLYDADGHRMSPSFGYGRGGKVYRYYVSAPLQQGRGAGVDRDVIRRVKAETLHDIVEHAVRGLMKDEQTAWAKLLSSVTRIDVLPDHLQVSFVTTRLAAGARSGLVPSPLNPAHSVMTLAVRCQMRGGRIDLVNPDGSSTAPRHRPDSVLIRGLRQAHRLAKTLGWEGAAGAVVCHRERPLRNSYERKLVRLAFLAPDLQQRILEGRQPPSLSLARLMEARMPTCWIEQQRLFG